MLDWFGARTVVCFDGDQGASATYEERVTIWQADSFEAATALAEEETRAYAENAGGQAVDLVQTFLLDGQAGHGAEVFSLMRTSALTPTGYVDRFFDTDAEHQAT